MVGMSAHIGWTGDSRHTDAPRFGLPPAQPLECPDPRNRRRRDPATSRHSDAHAKPRGSGR